MKRLIVVLLSLSLAACGGGGGDGDDEVEMPDDQVMPEEMPMEMEMDARVRQLGGIVERTEVLLMPGIHVSYSVSALGETISDSVLQDITCAGAACTVFGETIDLTDSITEDLIDPDVDISITEIELGTRSDGFHTASITGSLPVSLIDGLLDDITITEIPEVMGYGFWGEHGMAGLSIADGPFSGRAQSLPFSGNMQVVVPFAFGDASGTNPSGVGEASWTGFAEVLALNTFRRQEGSVTLTIPELLEPTLNVILRDDSGNPIGKPGWDGLALNEGHFMFGAAGDNYVAGNFHGADRSEAYGVFDTDNFTGAFGAKRAGQSE